MSRGLPSGPALQLITTAHSPVAGRKLATTLPLRPDWPRMLGDVTTLGSVHVDASNSAAILRCMAEPWTAHLANSLAWVSGPGIDLMALTDRWAFANIARDAARDPDAHLDICGHLGQRLLRVSLTDESAWERFGALVVSQWARRGQPAALPPTADLPPALERLEAYAGLSLSGSLSEEWFDADHRKYDGIPVDASLLAPFLETLSDQLCPLVVRLGNTGLLLQHEAAYWDYRQLGDVIRLRATTAKLDLALNQLAAARIVDGPQGRGDQWLRLYDEDCRCVLVIGLGRHANPDDATLWQCMLRALRE